MTNATLITAYLGKGLAAARPATPTVDSGCMALWFSTDTKAMSYWDGSAWQSLAAAGDPAITPMLSNTNPGWDQTFIGSASAFTNSGRTATPASSSPYNYLYGNIANYTGKKYFEIVPGSTTFSAVGLVGPLGRAFDNGQGSPGVMPQLTGQVGWVPGGGVTCVGVKGSGSATLGTAATWVATNVLSIAVDIDNLLAWFRVGSGNWNNSAGANPATGAGGFSVNTLWGGGPRLIWPAASQGNTSAITLNLNSANFAQTMPSGFSSWGGA